MRNHLIFSILLLFVFGCNSQTSPKINQNGLIGGPCEGCENFNKNKPDSFNTSDTAVLWNTNGKQLYVRGKVQNRKGEAVGEVEIYYWHTNSDGTYSLPDGIKQGEERFPQGWVKTDKDGRFDIYTIRPGAYPNRNIPAHIHFFVKEPNLSNAYYVDDLVFDDDRLLTAKYRLAMENRGGSGVLRLKEENGVSIGEYTMILGLNIPNHPDNVVEKSGLPVGIDSPSFTPFHAYGPDAGKRVCPVCKYGKNIGILHFTNSIPEYVSMKKWVKFYELLSEKYQSKLKVYIICKGGNQETDQLRKLGKSINAKQVALTIVPSFQDEESNVYLNEISPEVDNTIVIYNNSRIIYKLIDAVPEEQVYGEIERATQPYIGRGIFKY